MYSFNPIESLIIEHVISMSTTSKSVREPKLLSVHGKLDVINTVDGTSNFPHRKVA
jgi:hypothetical protein